MTTATTNSRAHGGLTLTTRACEDCGELFQTYRPTVSRWCPLCKAKRDKEHSHERYAAKYKPRDRYVRSVRVPENDQCNPDCEYFEQCRELVRRFEDPVCWDASPYNELWRGRAK
jgi:predicted  nucleic acid-binding Zn-ribbon protein